MCVCECVCARERDRERERERKKESESEREKEGERGTLMNTNTAKEGGVLIRKMRRLEVDFPVSK